jgi:hypothetical protein
MPVYGYTRVSTGCNVVRAEKVSGARHAADFGCRDAPGSTAGRCPPLSPNVPPLIEFGALKAIWAASR